MDGRELRLRIDEDTYLDRFVNRAAHVNFRPQNVGSDNTTFAMNEVGFLAGSTFPETA
jgi:hypothetical protein